MSMLRRVHDRHRDLRPRLQAKTPFLGHGPGLDRYVMTPLLLPPHRIAGHDYRWAWPGYAGARHKRPRGSSKPPGSPLKSAGSPGNTISAASPARSKLAPALHLLVPAATGVLFKDAMRRTKAAL